jgi:membrane associated rhomboid family serine protease
MNTYNELRYKVFNSGSRVNLFIGLNVIVFVLISIITVIELLFTKQKILTAFLYENIAVPTALSSLLIKPWTIFTYMFMHDGILHILMNMLWLYWIGRILEEYLTPKKITFLYILGGLAGAILYIACYNLIPLFQESVFGSRAVGASASVTAIIIAAATLLPNYTISMLFFGAVKLKWMAVVFILIDIISMTGDNAGGHITHLGGAIFGFVFIKSLKTGKDWSKPFENIFKKKPILKVVSKNYNSGVKVKNSLPDQEIIDEILDKISQSGYENLSRKEKDILFRASESNEEK